MTQSWPMRFRARAGAFSRLNEPQYMPAAPAARMAMRRGSDGDAGVCGCGVDVVGLEVMRRILGRWGGRRVCLPRGWSGRRQADDSDRPGRDQVPLPVGIHDRLFELSGREVAGADLAERGGRPQTV